MTNEEAGGRAANVGRKGLFPDRNFIHEAIETDLEAGRFKNVQTRFPPEPNGYLHIGHAKAFNIDFGMAEEYGGKCNLRFDDTNPTKEETEYVESIKEDIRWLGYDWEDREYYASDYFGQLYEWAVQLVKAGKAYVCDLSAEEVRDYRGTLTEPGKASPYRNRAVAENLDLFERMRKGEFPDGSRTLRARIDMAAPNVNLRDPVMYRILRATHHRTGDEWCIYPTYDWAHGQSDSIEKVSHSLCSLEFEDHRPLYEWFIKELGIFSSRQIEFARLNLTYTVMSKRRLRELVDAGLVKGWDDPRMPTLCGLRRRGYTAEAIKEFLRRVGVAKADTVVDIELLEHCLREDLNRRAPRVMAVLRPVALVIDNYPEGRVEEMAAANNPEDPAMGTRRVPFSRVLYIEQDDFREAAPPKYFRLYPGNEVRLRYGYIVRCEGSEKDPKTGVVTAVHCTYDPATRGGGSTSPKRVRGTIHWVSAKHALETEVRLYDRLFQSSDSDDVAERADWKSGLNPNSLEVLQGCVAEPGLVDAKPGDRFQFERLGYFCVDPDSQSGRLVFSRTVGLRDTWAKIEQAQKLGK